MTLMEDIHNIEHELDLNNQKFKESEHVSDQNKKAIQDFCDKCFAKGLGKARVRKYISNFHTILKMVDKDFSLEDAEREDIESLIAKIERSDYAHATKSDFKVAVRKFYKLMEGETDECPPKADFFDTHRDPSKKEHPDILEKEEINQIIDACKNDRDRAMYKVLYEAGLRAGELMALRIKDISFNNYGAKLNVRGKTGNRKILVVESERYLRNWLNKHPFRDRRNAPLWVKVDCRNFEEKTPEDMELSYDYMRVNLKRKALDAGVRVTTNDNGNQTSEVYPHLFRHTRATHLATELTEAAMKEYFGWTQNSDMPQTYIHLSGRDIDSEIMKMYGMKEKEEPEEKQCNRCMKEYKGEEKFCPRCGAPLSQEKAIESEELQKKGEELVRDRINGLSDEEILEIIS